MTTSRILYQNWIADLGHDPDRLRSEPPGLASVGPTEVGEPGLNTTEIRETVAAALASLDDDARELIERYYFIGQTYREMAERSGRSIYKLEALHDRAVRQLKKQLAPLVDRLYGLVQTRPVCPICGSAGRLEIDDLIAAKKPAETWRGVIRALRDQYGIMIKTPQTLIGHLKYH